MAAPFGAPSRSNSASGIVRRSVAQASAQSLDFLARTKNPSFPIWKPWAGGLGPNGG